MLRSLTFHLTLAFALASVTASERARACGVSATGVASCSLAEHRDATGPHFSLGATGTYTDTALRFGTSLRATQTRAAVFAVLAYLPTRSLALELGVGASFAGSLTLPDGKYEFFPGPSASLGVASRFLDAPSYFALLTTVASFSASHTELAGAARASYTAFDLRLGVEFGLNLIDVLHPYVLARAFGGPVYWTYAGESVTGTDVHHYQVGAGLAAGLPGRLSLFVEGVPLGERAISGGLGLAF
ncbi:MAG TPA: hypothetical protein VLJ38_22305 [Polyangiaceae bacterium]|nr:hypothetical protein [Polyangiaceae bacterium]